MPLWTVKHHLSRIAGGRVTQYRGRWLRSSISSVGLKSGAAVAACIGRFRVHTRRLSPVCPSDQLLRPPTLAAFDPMPLTGLELSFGFAAGPIDCTT